MASDHREDQIQPVAGVLAAFIPGLGHLWLREGRRALFIFVGVFGMFWGGILIGGVDVIDRENDFWWFVGQAGVGPTAFAVDYVHRTRLRSNDPPPNADPAWLENNTPRRTQSIGHPNEIGSLWATLAGMLNVICVVDALVHTPRRREDELASAAEGGAS